MIWIAFYFMRLDREIACDSFALKYVKREQHKEYGRSILILLDKISYNFRTPLSIGIINRKSEIRKRLKMLVWKGNIRKRWKVLFICIFIFLFITSFTKYVPELRIEEGLSIGLKHENLSKYSVALVAGHGGKDPGAIGINGFKEKDLTLSISKRIEKELSQTGIRVFSIRKTDNFIPLRKIPAIIDSIGPDVAVHIHGGYASDSTINGLTTYYQKHIPKSGILDSLLHNQLISHSSIVDRGSYTAPFFVLKGLNIPSVLIEPGYISNKEDLRKLQNDTYQDKISIAIKEAVLEYFHYYAFGMDKLDDDAKSKSSGSAGHARVYGVTETDTSNKSLFQASF
jgi:N-acetylmuramoyl-L-alanine amidase